MHHNPTVASECNFNLNTSYKFTEKFTISSYLGLWQEPQTIQTTYPFNTWHNVAFNYKIFKNKINISLRAVNYFEKTRDFKTITKDKNFYNTNITTADQAGCGACTYMEFWKAHRKCIEKERGE